MDIRFVLLGINMIAVAAIMSIYGWLIGSTQLIGVAGSIGIIGGVAVAVGLSHGEPTAYFLRDYYRLVSGFMIEAIEDLRLVNTLPRIVYLPSSNEYYVVLTSLEKLDGRNIVPGVTVVNGSPLLAFKIPGIYVEVVERPMSDPVELEARLRTLLVETYGVCTRLSLTMKNSTIELRLEGVDKSLLEISQPPLSPIDMVVLSILSQLMRASLYMENRSLEDDTYITRVRVVRS